MIAARRTRGAAAVFTATAPIPGSLLSGCVSPGITVWSWYPGKGEPERIIETPTKTQAGVLQAFGYQIGDGGVLQKA